MVVIIVREVDLIEDRNSLCLNEQGVQKEEDPTYDLSLHIINVMRLSDLLRPCKALPPAPSAEEGRYFL